MPNPSLTLSETGARAAVRRLAESVATGGRVVDAPLYRLAAIDIGTQLVGSVGIARFMEYALTYDLLEGELIDAIATQTPVKPGQLPLRDEYLPSLSNVIDTANRLCAGGVLALCAIARPKSRASGGAADYLLLVQERSGRVLNAARRLAVIPKSFHEPMVDFRDDAAFFMTLEREMEEELFGRDEVDSASVPSATPIPCIKPAVCTDAMAV